MRVKTCTRCGETKPLGQFPPVRRGEPKLQSWCRACFAEAGARHYRDNVERERARLYRNNALRRAESHRRVIDYLLAHPCIDCGESDIIVLQFDHLRDKKFDVSAMIASGASWFRIEAEIAKCVVRCANCHAKKTARDRGYRKLLATPTKTRLRQEQEVRPVQIELGTADTMTCRVCHIVRPVSDFGYRSRERGTRHHICRSCASKYNRDWWAKNRVTQMPRIRRNRAKRDRVLEQRIWDILFESPCVDCGETDLTVLHFDHLRDKVRDISTMWRSQRSWKAVELEIAKCEVRCANCHARKTAREQGSYRLEA